MDCHLTDRDRTLLRDLWQYRYLTSRHVARLHFGNHKVAQHRLRILTTAGFLQRFAPPDARRAGFQTWWYCLARAGARHVSTQEAIPLKTTLPPTRTPRTAGFLAHHALVTDFRLWLREACATAPGFSAHFLPGDDEARGVGRRSQRAALPLANRVLLPDGVFTLAKGDRHALFCLEIDRGTEPLTGKHQSSIARKFLAYREAYDARAEAHVAGAFPARVTGFRVLCVVPDQDRQARFVELAEQLDLAPLVWVTTHHVLQDRGRLDLPCWTVRSPTDLHALTE